MEKEKRKNHEQLNPNELQKYQSMANIAKNFYQVTSNISTLHFEEVYEEKEFIAEHMSPEWQKKLADYFNEIVQDRPWASVSFFASEMIKNGNRDRALEYVDEFDKKKISDTTLNTVYNASAKHLLEQGKPIETFKEATNIKGNIHSLTNTINEIILVSEDHIRGELWPQIEKLIDERQVEINKYMSTDFNAVLNNLVSAAVKSGDIQQAKQLTRKLSKYISLLEKKMDDMDTGPYYPQEEACVTVGKVWARLGEFDKAKIWIKKGKEEKYTESLITLCLDDWGVVPVETVIERWKEMEKEKPGNHYSYYYATKGWFESGREEEALVWWNWVKNNENFQRMIKNGEMGVHNIESLWNISQKIGDKDAEKFFYESLENVNPDEQMSTSINIDLYNAQKLQETGQNETAQKLMDSAWSKLINSRWNLEYHTESARSILNEWINLGSWDKVEEALDENSKYVKLTNPSREVKSTLLLMKYRTLLFEHKYGKFKDQKVDFETWGEQTRAEGWKKAKAQSAVLLFSTSKDITCFTNSLDDDQKTLVKVKISDTTKQLKIKSKIHDTLSNHWVFQTLRTNIGKGSETKRDVVKAALDHIKKWGERADRSKLIDILSRHPQWWNSNDESFVVDMAEVLNTVADIFDDYPFVSKEASLKLVTVAGSMIKDKWESENSTILKTGVKILGSIREPQAKEWLMNWITGHINDIASNEKLINNRIDFLLSGLDLNIDRLNILAYQLLSENIFNFQQTVDVIDKLVENRFFDTGVRDWWQNFAENHPNANLQLQIIKDLGILIKSGIFPRKEVLEKYFDNDIENEKLITPIETKIGINNELATNLKQSFIKVFSRDVTKIRKIEESWGVRCIVGSVFGKPVILLQNFKQDTHAVNGHHEITETWKNGAATEDSTYDKDIQKFIGKLEDEQELPVEHFLRGFLRYNENEDLVFSSDDGFFQSSVSARAELIPKVVETAKEFGIDIVENIPDDEYEELQRIGFMRGMINMNKNHILKNLGPKDASRYETIATRFYITREINEYSKSFELLLSYNSLIDYYRKGMNNLKT